MHQVIDQETGLIVTDDQQIMRLSDVEMFLATRPPIAHAKELRDRLAGYAEYYRNDVKKFTEVYEGQLRTERYIGLMLAEFPNANGNQYTKMEGDTMSPSTVPTLSDLGFTKKQSSRLQQLAEIPEDRFNSYIEAKKNAQEKITKTDILDLVKQVSARDEYDGDEWKTPIEWIEAARDLMGAIDLDPASHDTAQAIIQAGEYYTKDENGLNRPWNRPDGTPARVWCNPPYSTALVQAFTFKALEEYRAGNADQVLVLVNNCTDTQWFYALAQQFPIMFSRGRVDFWYEDPDDKTPTRQGQALFYFGPDAERFYASFAHLAYAPIGRRPAHAST